MSPPCTALVALLAAALFSHCHAALSRVPASAAQTLDGERMFAALRTLIQTRTRSAGATDSPGLPFVGRQGACSSESPAVLSCMRSCDLSKPTCTSVQGSSCVAGFFKCTAPNCCVSVKGPSDRFVITECVQGCCVAVDQDQKSATPTPCTAGTGDVASSGGSGNSSSSPSAAGGGGSLRASPAAGASPKPAAVVGGAAGGANASGNGTAAVPKASKVPSPSPSAKASNTSSNASSSSCFTADALVELASGAVVRMDALRVGDRVRVGAQGFSDVFLFTHKLAEVRSVFVVLRTASAHVARLTPGHYIYANGALVAAGGVRVGDELTLGCGARSRVMSVSVEGGLYNPQTLHGDIVVDGVVASTYTTAVSPVLGHAWLAPLRAVYRVLGATTGLLDGGADIAAGLVPGGGGACVLGGVRWSVKTGVKEVWRDLWIELCVNVKEVWRDFWIGLCVNAGSVRGLGVWPAAPSVVPAGSRSVPDSAPPSAHWRVVLCLPIDRYIYLYISGVSIENDGIGAGCWRLPMLWWMNYCCFRCRALLPQPLPTKRNNGRAADGAAAISAGVRCASRCVLQRPPTGRPARRPGCRLRALHDIGPAPSGPRPDAVASRPGVWKQKKHPIRCGCGERIRNTHAPVNPSSPSPPRLRTERGRRLVAARHGTTWRRRRGFGLGRDATRRHHQSSRGDAARRRRLIATPSTCRPRPSFDSLFPSGGFPFRFARV
jgi:Hint module